MAILKIAGAITVATKWNLFLKELAYAGFLFDAILALVAHVMVSDGEYMFSIIALITIPISYFLGKKVRPMYE